MGFQIQRARPADADAIAAFNSQMAMETEGKALAPDVIGAGVRRVLADSSLGFYLVARDGNALAGCLMVTYEWSDWRNGLFWWIQSVYIAPAYRRRGLYSAMYGRINELAREADDVIGFRLYVEQENAVAQRVYERLGMQLAAYRMYEAVF